jgi:hypothetical protein
VLGADWCPVHLKMSHYVATTSFDRPQGFAALEFTALFGHAEGMKAISRNASGIGFVSVAGLGC